MSRTGVCRELGMSILGAALLAVVPLVAVSDAAGAAPEYGTLVIW